VNILNSGMLTTDRIANLMRMTLERQTAFGHLTRLAVWVQRYVPICEKETDRAKKVRDERSRLCGNCRDACPQPSIAPLSKRSDMALASGIYTIRVGYKRATFGLQ